MKKITVMMMVALLPFILFAQEKIILKDNKTLNKEKPVIIMKKVMTPVKNTLKITSHADGQNAYGAIQILGTGEPGLKIKVSLFAFAEVTPKERSAWETFKMITLPSSTYSEVKKVIEAKSGTSIKEKYYTSYDVTIDNNGKWYIPVFQSFGKTEWMRNAFIPFAWVITAMVEDPNYREGNYVNIRLGCKM